MKRLLTILSLICFSGNILSNDYRLITLSGKDGLSQQDVECILQDKQGFIWIGTRDFDQKVVIDNERFDKEYENVSEENVFKYVNALQTTII